MDKLSFIPKTQVTPDSRAVYKSAKFGIFLKLSIFLLIVSVLLFAGFFIYRRIIQNQISDLTLSLERAKAAFDPDLILEIEKLSKTIPAAQNLLAQRCLPVNALVLLESSTLKDVRFTNFSYTCSPGPDQTPAVGVPQLKGRGAAGGTTVNLKGEARGYSVLGQQAEVLKKKSEIKSFSFSDFSLSDSGNVSFALEIIFNPVINNQ